MNGRPFSQTYLQHRKRGPFPERIDPWAETGRYFKQMHPAIIGHLQEQVQDPLEARGYFAGRETSLQVTQQREPDLYIERARGDVLLQLPKWDYATAAADALAEPGVVIDWDIPELDALHIHQDGTNRLVTVVEIISPSNKDTQRIIWEYHERREHLLSKGVNVVEIDLTRSVKRLLEDKLVHSSAYHAAVYIPEELPRFIGLEFGEPIKRIALPLLGEVIVVELQAAYDHAYQVGRIAAHILEEDNYTEDSLPFPTLLTNQQRQEALAAVAQWQAELERLRNES